jgi:AcrR family transcriptional regulator
MNNQDAPRRRYDSSLRSRQAEQTRETILRAAADLISDEGLQALSVPEVARRAGVSLRTVWRNFPSHESIMEELDRWIASMSPWPEARLSPSLDSFEEYVESLYAFLEENASIVQASLYWRFTKSRAPTARAERLASSLSLISSITSNLPAEVARRGEVAMAILPNGMSWSVLRKDLGLSGKESGEAVGWIMRLVIDELRRLNDKAGEAPKKEEGETPSSARKGKPT